MHDLREDRWTKQNTAFDDDEREREREREKSEEWSVKGRVKEQDKFITLKIGQYLQYMDRYKEMDRV